MLRFFHDISEQRKLDPALLAAALETSAAQTVLLNSECIEQCFGSYGIDVLASNASVRRANLYSLSNGVKICRTYAVVHFNELSNANYSCEHEEVLAGGSLGAIFKASGWVIRKQTLHIGTLSVCSQDSPVPELMRLPDNTVPALHVYQLLIAKNGRSFEYATIAEVHHPDYLNASQLLDIFRCDNSEPLAPQSLADLNELFNHDRLN